MNPIKEFFLLDPEVVFLNHGSFGACPKPVFNTYQDWQRQLETQPVKFFSKLFLERLADARRELGKYIHSPADDLVFIPNATFGVNVIARSLDLKPGDVVLTTDHEYGACRNAWEYVCKKHGASYIQQPISLPAKSSENIVEQFWSGVTPQTKVIFISHITSPTAIHLPVEEICSRARKSGIMTLIDGAHTPGQIPLDMETIGADFYTGNCHKWLMAPKGSAFLYARPEKQHIVEPLVVSWGWGENKTFSTGSRYLDCLEWLGTNDPAAYLSVPAAIKFQLEYNWSRVRENCHLLASQAVERICKLGDRESLYKNHGLFHQMATAPLPIIHDLKEFKNTLLDKYNIEIPCIKLNDMQLIRVSIQGYNSQSDVDILFSALEDLLTSNQIY